MTINKVLAWTIFRADKLQQPEGKAAVDALSKSDFEAYEIFAEQFDMELAQIGVEAQNEAAAIMEKHPELHALELIRPSNWNAMDYRMLVTPFEGSKFERLHLSAMFRVANAELLLELVKP